MSLTKVTYSMIKGAFSNVLDFGAVGDGSVDDYTAFVDSETGLNNGVFIPNGIYDLSANWNPLYQNASISSGTDVTFTTSKADFSGNTGIIPFQSGPIWSQNVITRKYESADWNGYGNIFQSASYVRANLAAQGFGGANVIAVYGGADAQAANSSAWASNFVAYANNATGTAIASEINFGSLVSGGLAYGIVLASSGNFTPTSAMQIQANNSSSVMQNGIVFNNRAHGLAIDSLISISGNTSVSPASVGIDFNGFSFSGAEINTTSFTVQATQPNTVNKIAIRGAATTHAPSVRVSGSDTDIDLALVPKGAGLISFGTRVANADAPITGYIEIKDIFGVTRKLALIS